MTTHHDASTTSASGWVESGFESVRAAFEENFSGRGEVGAAFAATLDGKPIVDLWGGLADSEQSAPWREDTLVVVFSGTKALVATCILILIDRQLLDLDEPVATYWPEFAADGKSAVLVSDVVSHQARMPAVRTPLTVQDMTDGERIAALLAAQPQETDPRAAGAYHGMTYGWLCGELIRRVDGRTVGRFFADEIATPLGLEIWIGLPPTLEHRVARLEFGRDWIPMATAEEFARDDLLRAAWQNPGATFRAEMPWNTAEFHQSEIPGGGGIATARSMARFYGCLARGGELDGIRLLEPATLARGRQVLSDRRDPLQHDYHHVFATGFQLQNEYGIYGPPPDTFGHSGAGGGIHCAWPTQRVGVSYAMNQMRNADNLDPRSDALLRALYDCVDNTWRQRLIRTDTPG